MVNITSCVNSHPWLWRHFGENQAQTVSWSWKSVQVNKSDRGEYSEPHLLLMITIWNRVGLAEGQELGPPSTFKLSNCHVAPPLPHCTQHQCVYRIHDPVINKFSIFCSPRCLANIKGGKAWCGISVCLHSILYEKNSLGFSPKIHAWRSHRNWFSGAAGLLPGR